MLAKLIVFAGCRCLAGLGVLLAVCDAAADADPADSRLERYREIEAYRESKSGDLVYGGRKDDAYIRDWVEQVWKEGWVRKAGFDIHMGRVRSALLGDEEKGKSTALQQLNSFTERVYADGSVGNVREKSWKLSSSLSGIYPDGSRVRLLFGEESGLDEYGLELSFYRGGILHFIGGETGYFDCGDLESADVRMVESEVSLTVEYVDEPISVIIEKSPFSLQVFRGDVLKFHQTGFDVAGAVSDPRGVRLRFAASEEDEYIGFGERFDRFRHKGTVFAQWSMGMAEALSKGSPETYKPIPFYLNPVASTGMFNNHGGIVRWDLEDCESGVVDVSSVGGICDYFLFLGEDPYDVYRAYTSVTGRIFEVQEWVHMPWMGHHFGGVPTVADRRERLVDELVNFDKYGLTYGAMYAAGVSSEGPEIEAIFERYMEPLDLKLGAHLIPTVRKGRPAYEALPQDELDDFVVMREDGTVFISDHAFQSGCAYYDYSSPRMVEQAFEGGIHQVFMLDFGEQVAWDGVLSGYPGYSGLESHNLYQYLYHKAAFVAHERRHPNGDWMSFARSAWAGSHALGGFFAGDTSSSMEDLVSTIRAGINMCASAGVYWGADIGAYKRQTPLTKERYLRWAQFGLFSPLMRTHAHESKEMRPWMYDDEMLAAFTHYTWLRASLVPYIREAGIVATAEGIPIMRALPLEFPKDRSAYLGDEYLFGPDLLVAPYVDEGVHAREVYLPEGTWYNFFTNEKREGATRFEQRSPSWLEMPVYVRAPAVLPVRIGANSPELGRSYFESSGTKRYSNEAIEAFRIYPKKGRAESVFSHGKVSYSFADGVVALECELESGVCGPVHFEVLGVRSLLHQVSVNGVVFAGSQSWSEMMAGENRYFFDEASDRLFVICGSAMAVDDSLVSR